MKIKYQLFSNINNNRQNSTPKTLIFPKKLLILICFLFLLPSTLSRCITLPENVITAKGRKARVRFSSTDCSIQKINVPLRLQEKSAGLIPLKFKVYEYGTKPEEYATSTSIQPTVPISDLSTSRPELEDPVEPVSSVPTPSDDDGKWPLPDETPETPGIDMDLTQEAPGIDIGPLPENPEAPGNETDLTQEAPGNDLGPLPENPEAPGNDPDIAAEAPDNDPDLTQETPGNDPDLIQEAPGNNPDLTQEAPGNDMGPLPENPEAPDNGLDITQEAPGNDLGQLPENPESPGNVPDITAEASGNDLGPLPEAPGNDLGPLPEAPGNDLGPLPENPEAPGNDLDITTEAPGNNLVPLPEAPGNDLGPLPEAPGNDLGPLPENPEAPGNDLDITTEAPGNNLVPLPEAPGNDLGPLPEAPGNDLGPLPENPEAGDNDLDITTEAPGNDPDMTTEAPGNDLGPLPEALGNDLDITTEAPGNEPDITTGITQEAPDITTEAPGNDPVMATGITQEAPGNDQGTTTEMTQEAAGNDLGPLPDITTEAPSNNMGPLSHVTTAASSNDISSFQVENIISYVTEVELPSGEIVDEQNDIEDGIEHQSNAPQTEQPGDVEEHGGADDTAGSTTQSVVTEGIPAGSDEEEEDPTQHDPVNEGGHPAELDGANNNAGANSQSVSTGGEAGPTEALAGTSEDVEETTTQEGGAGTTLQTSSGADAESTDANDGKTKEADVTRQPGETIGETNINEEVTGQHDGTIRETSTDDEGTEDGYPMSTPSLTNQVIGDNVEQAEASSQYSASTVHLGEEARTTTTGNREPGYTDNNAGATMQLGSANVGDLGITEDDVVTEEDGTGGPAVQVTTDGPGEEAATDGGVDADKISTRQTPSLTTAESSGIGEETVTEDHVESNEDLITTEEEVRSSTKQPVGQTHGQSNGIGEEAPTAEHGKSDEDLITTVEPGGNIQGDGTTKLEEEPSNHDAWPGVTPTPPADSTQEEASSDKPEEVNTNAVGGSTGQHIEVVVESPSSTQPDGSYEEANTNAVGDSSDTHKDSSSTKQPGGADEEANANTIGGSSVQSIDDTDKEEVTDSASTERPGAPEEEGHTNDVGGSPTEIEIAKDHDYVEISTTLGTNTVKTSATNKILLTTKNQEALTTIQPAHDSTEGFVHAMDGGALTISDLNSGFQPNLSDGDMSTTSLQPGFTVVSGNAETTSQTSGGKAETSSKPDPSADAVDSQKPSTQVSGDSAASVAGAGKPEDVNTIDTQGLDITVLPNLSNAGTEAQSTATNHAAGTSTSRLEEADVVINLKTVASNIILNTINIDDGGNGLTTRQLNLYTGSTNDDMIPDQTRHNDLQDLTTQTMKTTENMISKTDILTQEDSSQIYDHDTETTIHIQTTTDNSFSEGQAPELNPSLPGSPTYVNTNANNLPGETKHPLSTQLEEGQTKPFTIEENESNSEEISKGPTNPTLTDTTLDSGNTIDIQFGDDNNQHPATPEPDEELNINLAKQDLTPESVSSTSTTPCICPATTTSFGTTTGSTTMTGTTTASGDCLCPDIILGPAEVETATDLPVTSGGRRRREWDDDDLYVDDFDQKILKKMPFLKFY